MKKNDVRAWVQEKPDAPERFVHIWQMSDSVIQVAISLDFEPTEKVRHDLYQIARRMRAKGITLKKFPPFAGGRKNALDWDGLAKYAEKLIDDPSS